MIRCGHFGHNTPWTRGWPRPTQSEAQQTNTPKRGGQLTNFTTFRPQRDGDQARARRAEPAPHTVRPILLLQAPEPDQNQVLELRPSAHNVATTWLQCTLFSMDRIPFPWPDCRVQSRLREAHKRSDLRPPFFLLCSLLLGAVEKQQRSLPGRRNGIHSLTTCPLRQLAARWFHSSRRVQTKRLQ